MQRERGASTARRRDAASSFFEDRAFVYSFYDSGSAQSEAEGRGAGDSSRYGGTSCQGSSLCLNACKCSDLSLATSLLAVHYRRRQHAAIYSVLKYCYILPLVGNISRIWSAGKIRLQNLSFSGREFDPRFEKLFFFRKTRFFFFNAFPSFWPLDVADFCHPETFNPVNTK